MTDHPRDIAAFLHDLPSAEQFDLPTNFTFPFYYTPHPIAVAAVEDLQNHLTQNLTFEKRFKSELEGKMFGVLVVEKSDRSLAYLSAYSGKLLDSYVHNGFVPPLFDMLQPGGFFKKGEAQLNQLTADIALKSANPKVEAIQAAIASFDATTQVEESELKSIHQGRKKARKLERVQLENRPKDEQERQMHLLGIASSNDQNEKKEWRKNRLAKRLELTDELDELNNEIQALKAQRAALSAAIQETLFEQYNFLNALGQQVNVRTLFDDIPPAGTGECAAPKLLQFAYKHQLKPIALAEFWWGNPPQSAIRKHGHFYPACKSKCEPVLTHMLKGLQVDPNPLNLRLAEPKRIDIIYEDESLCVVNKPADLLSVPGKEVHDSVLSRMQEKHPEWTGPIIVHRLDFSTSGLLVLAKNEAVYKQLQAQFVSRSVQKRYCARLNGHVESESGFIDLPLRVDLDDRPRQLVCFNHGKPAQTRWTKVSSANETTLVHFYPITGRTHQLRVHAAHSKGLNTAIVGDELYGHPGKRLMLHAEFLQIQHPVSLKQMKFKAICPF